MITAPYNKEGFEVLPVCKEPWVALLPHEHPLAKLPGDSVTPEQLLPYDLLIPSRESPGSHEIDQWFGHRAEAHYPGPHRPYGKCLRAQSPRRRRLHLPGFYLFPDPGQ